MSVKGTTVHARCGLARGDVRRWGRLRFLEDENRFDAPGIIGVLAAAITIECDATRYIVRIALILPLWITVDRTRPLDWFSHLHALRCPQRRLAEPAACIGKL